MPNLAPITEIAAKLDIPESELSLYGNDKAKLSRAFTESLKDRDDGKLILVSAMTPTKFGEGKTTTSVGLSDGLTSLGKRAGLCLREPSLGPVFGMKGGGTGGGVSTMEPSDEINLHFTGDIHAVSSAHNLLAAMLDNHIYWGNELGIDIRRETWRRAMDMNERALRQVLVNLGGVSNGFPRETGFDITAASEIMAILCLAENTDDLKARLGDIVVGRTRDRKPVTCRELQAEGAMAALLNDAIRPNLIQTADQGTPTFCHGGPFANIAHGCNSVVATKSMLKLADYVVTEAGFGADLGAEKFLDIKCRVAGLNPSAAVLVATIRALKAHAGTKIDDVEKEDVAAVEKGFANLARHGSNMQNFGLPAVVALNRFGTDTDAEIEAVQRLCEAEGLQFQACTHFADGAKGAAALAERIVDLAENDTPKINYTYDLQSAITDKIEAIATKIYRADGIEVSGAAARQIAELEDGWGDLPVCMAKTQSSFTADPTVVGAPDGFTVPIREVRLSAGARFVVAICGDMMTMPGLPRKPAAETITVDDGGNITGVF